ncbi:MAG TPA: cytochrome P450 [Longimicrobium sp.]|nr:cytochrome P450 [Longimicrobium sp.]
MDPAASVPAPPSRRLAPGPRGNLLLGSMGAIHRRGQVGFFHDCWREYGDLFQFRIGPARAHVVAHPDNLRKVLATNRQNYEKGLGYKKTRDLLGLGLLTSEGELWQRQRRLMQPPFTQKSVATFGAQMVGAVEAMLRRWRPFAEKGEPFDVHREMLRLAITIIGQAMLGLRTEGEGPEGELVEAYSEACEVINARLASFLDVPLVIPTPANRRLKRAVRVIDRLVYALVEERRREGPRPDLLSRMLEARDEDTGEAMSPRQLRDEIITLFFAGHETSAVTLTWTWFLLSQHPAVEEALHAELATVLGGRAPTSEELPRLVYTRMVIEESMRLYPPVWTFPRAAVGEDELSGHRIPAGALVFPAQYLTHRHPAFWTDPESFQPERFAPGRAEQRPPFAYLPFGGGPRTCIGIHFAMMETVLALATVAQRYRLRLVPGHPVEPTSIITLQPRYGMRMMLEAR